VKGELKMIKINWKKFEIKNEDYRKSFEELSYFLFCRKFKINSGIFGYKNQAGIETEPILNNKKYIGFQAKWFDSKINKKDINDSIKKAKDKNQKLNTIIFYINQKFSESSKSKKKESVLETEIKAFAKKNKIDIEWVLPSHFEIILNQASNLDLAQLYFDSSDEFGFINFCVNPEIQTFLQSSEYIELPFVEYKTNESVDIPKEISKSKQKSFLITGHPGSGKSIYIHKLFQIFSGLNQNSLNNIQKILLKNNAIPMLINLKNCVSDTLENIIRNRQKDYNIRGKKLGFIYLLDGLDELSIERADNILSYLCELAKNDDTKKIIISCRSGNLNKIKARSYLANIIEYQICDLSKEHINNYFNGKNNDSKNNLLKKLSATNEKLLTDIKDILLINLLWDTIENIDKNSTIINLLDSKIKLLLKNIQYAKNIEELNLLDPKGDKIIELNKEISFEFQNKSQFQFSQEDIQEIILNKYPRIDYKAANEILKYIATLFFVDSSTFIYKHRRYQDFFFIQKLAEMYEENPKCLRKLSILSNRDFFENLFLPYLRSKYSKERNLPRIIELDLFDVYLGNSNYFGVSEPAYKNSSEFMPSLAIQNNDFFQELLDNDSFNLKEKIFLDLNEIENKFTEWEKDKNDYALKRYLNEVWEENISYLLENIIIFWKFGKQEISNNLIKNMNAVKNLFEKYQYNEKLRSSFREKIEEILFLRIIIEGKNVNDMFANIRFDYENPNEHRNIWEPFFRICIDGNQQSLSEIILDLNNDELLILLDSLVSVENIHLLIENNNISKCIKNKIANISIQNVRILFCKTIYNQKISEHDRLFLENEQLSIREKSPIDWRFHGLCFNYALISYVLNKNSFAEYLNNDRKDKYYDELGLYAALFRSYIEMQITGRKIEPVARDYIRFIHFYTRVYHCEKILKFNISSLWAHIFAISKEETQKLLNIKNSLMTVKNNIVPIIFYPKLQYLDKNLFRKLVNKSNLGILENELNNWNDDYSSYVDHCFSLALLFADIDKQKVIGYFAKGLNNGTVRHGWRKDHIVSDTLVESLEILYRNNWLSKEELGNYSKTILDLNLRLVKITDDAGTGRGINNIITLTSKYDIDLAIKLKDKLEEMKNISNSEISSILSGKIMLGKPFDEIEEGMNEYTKSYYEGKPHSSYYEEKFKIYMEVALSNFYTEEENKQAFERAYKQVEEMINHKIEYSLSDRDFREVKENYINLCKKYKKEINITLKEDENEYKREIQISEADFMKDLNNAKTSPAVAKLYEKLSDYKNNIILTKPKSWELLIEKTYLINKNIKVFTELLKKNNFPRLTWYSSNSDYFHFGLGYAIKNTNTKEEIMNYLFDGNTGYDAFFNIMKSYEYIGDKEMCVKLFEHYLKFCDFLVN